MKILFSLKLLLPAILPSWNFFDVIAPSPRIQFTVLNQNKDPLNEWAEFRPRPAHLTFYQMLRRIFWNPSWNESLFLVSCAERLMHNPLEDSQKHSEDEILNCIMFELKSGSPPCSLEGAEYLQFRLIFVCRVDQQLQQEITYVSRAEPLSFSSGSIFNSSVKKI